MRDHKNLTLRIDAQVLLWARMRALRDGTSINRRIRRYLEEYAAIPPDQRWQAATWPDADPGAAGNPGAPADHAHLAGADGYRVSTRMIRPDETIRRRGSRRAG